MATYVLVHGGGHGGWCYQRVARILGDAGHVVYAPTLTGLGERAHLLDGKVDLDLRIRDVVAVLHHEDLRDVILVGHSYGGMVITGVADRATERVGRLEAVSDPDVPTSPCCGSAAKLADGSWLMSWGGTRVVTEFGATGDRHFELTFTTLPGTFSAFSYRVDAIVGASPTIQDLRAGMDAMP